MAERKAVIYIITQLELGGAQKVCAALAHGMQVHGWHTILIAGPGILQNQLALQKVHLLATLERSVGLGKITNELRSLRQLIHLLKQYKNEYETIIVHTHSTKAGILGRWAAWWAGISVRIHTVHGFAFHEHQSRPAWLVITLIEWMTSWVTTEFVCVSQRDQKTGSRLLPRFKQHNTLICAAIAPAYFKQMLTHQRPTDHFIIGTISCFKPQKNILDLLKAFQAIYRSHAHTRLEIIGDGAQRPFIEQWIRTAGLQDVITLHGWQEYVIDHLKRWHLFALSSLWEGLPCAVVEARRMQLPVVSYDVGGISQVIINGRNGILCTPQDWHALAHAAKYLMDNPDYYHALASYQDDLKAFTYEHMCEQHHQLYERLTTIRAAELA